MDGPRDEDPCATGRPAGHQGRFGRGRGTVIVGSRNDVEVHELADERLVFIDALERALADLRLVRRVRGVPLAAQEQLVDGGRRPVAIDTGSQERGEVGPVASREALEPGRQFEFRLRFRQGQPARPKRHWYVVE